MDLLHPSLPNYYFDVIYLIQYIVAKHLGRYDASVFFTLQIYHLKRSNGDGSMPSSRGILHATFSGKVWLVPILMFIFLRHEAKILSFLKALHHFFVTTSAKITLRFLLSVINCFNGLLQSALENKSKRMMFSFLVNKPRNTQS